MRRLLVIAVLIGGLIASLAACQSSGDAGSAKSAAASVTADPQFLAAKALVVHCFAGTPVQQARQIHLVFLSSSTGKNGPAVIAARAKLGTCLGISKSDEQPFFNDAVKAAEHQKPRLHVLHPVAWITAFFGKTLPPVVIRYSNAPGLGTSTASPGAKASPSTKASAKASTS
jgi:hypothetical protein